MTSGSGTESLRIRADLLNFSSPQNLFPRPILLSPGENVPIPAQGSPHHFHCRPSSLPLLELALQTPPLLLFTCSFLHYSISSAHKQDHSKNKNQTKTKTQLLKNHPIQPSRRISQFSMVLFATHSSTHACPYSPMTPLS